MTVNCEAKSFIEKAILSFWSLGPSSDWSIGYGRMLTISKLQVQIQHHCCLKRKEAGDGQYFASGGVFHGFESRQYCSHSAQVFEYFSWIQQRWQFKILPPVFLPLFLATKVQFINRFRRNISTWDSATGIQTHEFLPLPQDQCSYSLKLFWSIVYSNLQ